MEHEDRSDLTDGAEEATRPIPRIPAAPAAPEPPADPAPGSPVGADDGRPDAPTDSTGAAAQSPKRPRRSLLIPVLSTAGLLLVLATAYLVDLLVTSGEVERNTTIAGVEVGGLSPEEAGAAISAALEPTFTQPHQLTVHGQQVQVHPDRAGLSADVAAAVQQAGTRSANPIDRVRSFFTDREVALPVAVDQDKLVAFVADTAADTDVTPVEGELKVSGTTVDSVTPVTGWELDRDKAAELIEKAWRAQGPAGLAGLELPAAQRPVRVSPAALAAGKQAVGAVLSGPVTVQAGDKKFTIGVEAIAAATTITPDGKDGFTVTIDVGKVRAPLTAGVQATHTKPADGSVAIKAGKPVVTPSVDGRTTNWAKTDEAIRKAITGTDRTAEVVYDVERPKITDEVVKSWGIKEVIGEFKTGGFAYTSGVNVRVVAQKVQGAFIGPGKTFSLNDFTGPRGTAEGYVEAGILIDGAPATAVGGGISQFATTLYNASYFAGLRDVTHQAHSIYISRYPAGREATVFEGQIDLAFANDYPTAVIIETIWTEEDITVRLWGTKHVKVESIGSDRYDYTNPPVITRPYGQPCSAQGGSSGFSVDDTRVIYDLSGKELKREKQTTVYNGSPKVVCEPPPAPPTTAAPPTTPPAAPPGTDPATPPATG